MQEFKVFVSAAKTPTSRCLVGSSSDLYPWVLQTIISLNVCFSVVFQCNYFIFFHNSKPTPPPPTAEETWTTNLLPVILNILPHLFLTSTRRCPRFKPDRLVILV